MNWYEPLYMGRKAAKRRFEIAQGLREGKWQPDVYVILPPRSENHVFEIVPAVMLLSPHYRDEDLTVLGIALTYWEALEVARDIVDDMYQRTGRFCLADLPGLSGTEKV